METDAAANHEAAGGGRPRRRPGAGITVVLAVALVVFLVSAVRGFTAGSGPSSTSFGPADTAVIVSIPGLRWQDLVATDTPAIDSYLGRAGVLSVRAIGPETDLLEGYLTLGAGNRVEAAGVSANLVDGRCVPGVLAAAAQSAVDDLNGAEPGALGTTLREAGVRTSVRGSADAIAGLMGVDGCVDAYSSFAASRSVPIESGVTLVELAGLENTDLAAERSELLERFDAELARLDVPPAAMAMLVAPTAIFDRAEVTVFGVRNDAGETRPGSVVSPTTRRADYVTLADVAPAVLAAFGIEAPDSMNGAEVRGTVDGSGDVDRDAQQRRLADLAERVEFRDRAVGPVSVVMVVLMVLCGVAALGRRHRLARTLAPIVAAYPTVAFATGLVAYHQLPLNFVVVMVPCAAVVIAAMAVSGFGRFGAWAPVGALIALHWLVQVVDVMSGGHLQINTPLGYTPTIAGRFQGYGNLSFGLVGASAVVVAVMGMHTSRGIDAARPTTVTHGARSGMSRVWWVAAWVGAMTAVAVAAPAYGSDVGGTLAIVPTFAVIVAMMAGYRIGWRRLLLLGVGSVVLVAALGALDLSRPNESRTHLGRFLDDLIHGDGGLVIRRKMRGNLSILTSSFWSYVLIAAVLVGAAVAWRYRPTLRSALLARPGLRVFVAGFAMVAFLGFALNDSGIAVPAIMLAIAVPWVVASVIPIARRTVR